MSALEEEGYAVTFLKMRLVSAMSINKILKTTK